MILYKKIAFTVRRHGEFAVNIFISPVEPGDYELLGYIFFATAVGPDRILDLALYTELLQEIERLESGELERGMVVSLADYSDSGEMIVGKESTVFVRESEKKRVEIPTAIFKRLIYDWLEFVEVNSKIFLDSKWT